LAFLRLSLGSANRWSWAN